jgi:hypothetical protein
MPGYFKAVDKLYDHAFKQGFLVVANQVAPFMDHKEWALLQDATPRLNLKQLLDCYQGIVIDQGLAPAWIDYHRYEHDPSPKITGKGAPVPVGRFVFHALKGEAAGGLLGYLMAMPLKDHVDQGGMRHFTILPFRQSQDRPGPEIELRVARDYVRLSWEVSAGLGKLEELMRTMRRLDLFAGLQVSRHAPRLQWEGLAPSPPTPSPVTLVGDAGLKTLMERITPKRATYQHDDDK